MQASTHLAPPVCLSMSRNAHLATYVRMYVLYMPIQRGSETISESSARHTVVSASSLCTLLAAWWTAWPDDRLLWETVLWVHTYVRSTCTRSTRRALISSCRHWQLIVSVPAPQTPDDAQYLRRPQTHRSNVAYHCNRGPYHRRGLREVRSVMTSGTVQTFAHPWALTRSHGISILYILHPCD